jgi:hypothetical protein
MNGKRGILLLVCLGLISAAVLPIITVIIAAATTSSPLMPFSQAPGKNDPAENKASSSSDVPPSPLDATIMQVSSTNVPNSSNLTENSNAAIVSSDTNKRIIMSESFKTEYTLDYDDRDNRTLHAIIAKGARDQISDAVHTIASNSATVNATGVIRNLVTDTTAELDGMEIIKDVARSQIESTLLIISNGGNQTAATTTATGSQLTLETETELTCEYVNRSYAECEITMNIG